MIDLKKLVEERLDADSDLELSALWKAIWDSYAGGGPGAVEAELQERLKAIKKAAAKEIRASKEAVPARKRRARRRR